MTLALKLRSARAENLSLDKTTTLYFSVLDLLSTFQHPSRVDHIANLILLLIFQHYLRTVAGECSQASDLDGQCPNYLIGSASTGCWRWCENCENCKNNLVWSMINVHNTHAVVEVQIMSMQNRQLFCDLASTLNPIAPSPRVSN